MGGFPIHLTPGWSRSASHFSIRSNVLSAIKRLPYFAALRRAPARAVFCA